MRIKNLFLICLSLIILSGCMGSAGTGKRKARTDSNSTTDKPTIPPTFTSAQALYWFTTQSIQGTLQVSSSADTIVYLRGSYIHNYLSATNTNSEVNGDSSNPYCLYIKFSDSTCDKNALRVRAVPMKVNDVINNTVERIFKISLANNAENYASCGFLTIDSNTPSSSAYQTKDVCTNKLASLSVTSSEMTLFQLANINTAPTLSIINQETVPLNNLKLKVDLTTSSNIEETTCSNSSCSTKGYDCCVNGQCVNNATVKSGNFSNTPEFLQAVQDVQTNPLNFLKYPQYYNICTNQTYNPPSTGNGGNDTSNKTAAQLRVEKYIADYTCIYNAEVSEYPDYSQCNLSTAPSTGTEVNYKATKAKLAIACGCPTEYDELTREIKCPNWGIRPIYSSTVQSLTNIVDFYCYNPPPTSQADSIINTKIDVSSRSAPHRFYDKNGDSYDDIKKSNPSITQEGNEFYYADNVNKAFPVSGEFNVNAILGSMNISLTGTRPAQMMQVVNGQSYIISTLSGTYTPCPSCVKDSWTNLFTAHPSSTFGNGLRAAGYTTIRDELKGNTTYGNYEDTKFGRACYVPVTMLPFSHLKNLDLKTQRQNRLQTQSAFYVNGYQRDWFGFNKGALIGSFDGVKWFAIGTGRRITATTDKLYLAINDSYLDLAATTNHVVSVRSDASGNSVSDYDYDPTRSLVDAYQNQAATCQKFHQCKVDSDCVSQLGWEYSCVDVSTLKTNWPIFDGSANEISNQEFPSLLIEILSNQISMGESTKRCVYRGAGAPCVKNLESLSSNINAKYLTCAPNFYCASADAGVYNSEVARSANDLDNVLFGMDTNILGRPLNYVSANGYLSTAIIGNIRKNASSDLFNLNASQTTELGMCRPGKRLVSASNLADSTGHSDKDSSMRTDYINQISSCDSSALSYNRTAQCPEFDEDGNYVYLKNPSLPVADLNNSLINRYSQNMCGREAVNNNVGNGKSAFDLIEALRLSLSSSISEKTLVRDACLRRSGGVCFTDLDCGPNRLHAKEATSLSTAYFGNTDAEHKFWTESLVCGQGNPVPTLNESNYLDYDMTQNRCCREIGKDFTMYTQGPSLIVPNNSTGNLTALVTDRLAAEDPKATGRYSRYASSKTLINHLRTNAAATNENPTPKVSTTASPNPNQWKVINETGSSNCCGGGWVRKFNDNTNNWSVTNRFNIDPENFSCLNYRTPMVASDFASNAAAYFISKDAFMYDNPYFCYYLGNNGCVQIPWPSVEGYEITPPKAYDPASPDVIWGGVSYNAIYSSYPASGHTRLDTSPTDDPKNTSTYGYRLNADAPFIPTAYKFTQWNFDLGLYNGSVNATPDIFFLDKTEDYGVSMYLPSYIQYNSAAALELTGAAHPIPRMPSVRKIYIKYFNGTSLIRADDITSLIVTGINSTDRDNKCRSVATADPNPIVDGKSSTTPINAISSGTAASWCVTHQPATLNRPILHVKASTEAALNWTYAGIVIEFEPLENTLAKKTATPGNMYYYLEKFGRFELLGIPQITYEPLYCNDDHDKVVPGLFNPSLARRTNFASKQTYNGLMSSYTDHDVDNNFGNFEKKFVYQNDIKDVHTPVFSDSNFKCCTPLGKKSASMGNCCSGYGVQQNGEAKYTCALPNGTDLNVYFNKFVSSEGVGEDEPEGGLITQAENEIDVDFDQFTGEPKLRDTTMQKILALGQAYCASGMVANGGAFAQFAPQPSIDKYVTIGSNGNQIVYPFSIVDSSSDAVPGAGRSYFSSGKRWDHHYYCVSE